MRSRYRYFLTFVPIAPVWRALQCARVPHARVASAYAFVINMMTWPAPFCRLIDSSIPRGDPDHYPPVTSRQGVHIRRPIPLPDRRPARPRGRAIPSAIVWNLFPLRRPLIHPNQASSCQLHRGYLPRWSASRDFQLQRLGGQPPPGRQVIPISLCVYPSRDGLYKASFQFVKDADVHDRDLSLIIDMQKCMLITRTACHWLLYMMRHYRCFPPALGDLAPVPGDGC